MLCNVQFITINENYLNIHYKPKYKFKFYLIIKKLIIIILKVSVEKYRKYL